MSQTDLATLADAVAQYCANEAEFFDVVRELALRLNPENLSQLKILLIQEEYERERYDHAA